jgi:hypothetical protein
MESTGVNRQRLTKAMNQLDDYFLGLGKRAGVYLYEHRYLLSVLLVGALVWAIVFNIALSQYLTSSANWNHRAPWLGPISNPGEVEVFGYTILYQFEGYSDYSFYYVHWGHNFLNGVMPYSDAFGYLEMDGIINQNGAHMFPPLTAYLYAAGIALGDIIGPGDWGIGLLIAGFGYLTAIPVYGLAKEFSNNRRVGEIAALTYLINPLVLFHICFTWMNPAPFYFFVFAGFYALVKNKRLTGTLLIVTAALFKQSAWFFGIPLVVYLLMKPRTKKEPELEEPEKRRDFRNRLDDLISSIPNYINFKGFFTSVIVVLVFVGAIMFPILVAQPWFWDYWRLALGAFSFEGNFVDPPPYGVPMRLPVLAIISGQPDLAETIDTLILSGGPFAFCIILAAGVMLLTDRFEGEQVRYLRSLLFVTLLMMLCVNLFGVRGVFKYYFTVFGPLFSIFGSAKMITSSEKVISPSLSMIYVPLLFSILILVPPRNIYLIFVVLILVLYLLAPLLGKLYDLAKRPFRRIKDLASSRISAMYDNTLPAYQVQGVRSLILVQFVRLVLFALGFSMIAFGTHTFLLGFGLPSAVTFQHMIVGSLMILLGFQIGFLPLSGLLPSQDRFGADSDAMRILTTSIVGTLWIFGVSTYVISLNIDVFPAKQLLVFAGVFLVIWPLSLVILLKRNIRIGADLLLLIASIVGVAGWTMVGNTLFVIFALTCVAASALHLFLYVESRILQRDDAPRTQSNSDTMPLQIES